MTSQRVASQFLSQQNSEVMLHVLFRGDTVIEAGNQP